MRPIDSIKFNHKNSTQEASLNHIEAIKNKISSLDLERDDCHCSKAKDKSADFFDIFRQVKNGFMNIINIFHQTGNIDNDDYKEKKSGAKELFKEFGSNVKKLFLNIAQRDLQTQLEYIDSQILGVEPNTSDMQTQQENKDGDGKNLQLTLTSTLKLNNIGNSLLNLLNNVDPFQSPDELDPNKKDILTTGINNIHAQARELMLALDPNLKEDLDNFDKKVAVNPDKKEAYLNYSVAMIPIDIASKAIDVVNNEREGYQELANKHRKTLSADMLDFYEYLSNIKENLT